MPLIDNLIQDEWLKTERIINAFRIIKRKDFLPEDDKDLAELNQAMPIGHGQTISQPLVVAFMLELLQPQPEENILDVGSGSGWTTALLAHIVSQEGNPKSEIRNPKKGKVTGIEIIPELMEFGKNNISKYNFIEKGIVKLICVDGSKGHEKQAPFDKILCSAAIADKVPDNWKKQLKIGGRIVTPIKNSIWLIVKKGQNEFEIKEHHGFAFVPLVAEKGKR